MKNTDESYAAFQDSIFRDIHHLNAKYVGKELIKLALEAGMSKDELIQLIRSSKDETGDDILSVLHARIDAKKKEN